MNRDKQFLFDIKYLAIHGLLLSFMTANCLHVKALTAHVLPYLQTGVSSFILQLNVSDWHGRRRDLLLIQSAPSICTVQIGVTRNQTRLIRCEGL